MSRGRRNPNPQQRASAFEGEVMALAKLLGWRRAHFRAARTIHGWRTPVSGDGAGFPDLFLLHTGDKRALMAECKSGPTSRLTKDQRAWLEDAATCGIETAVFRDDDWEQIVSVLSKGRQTTVPRARRPWEASA